MNYRLTDEQVAIIEHPLNKHARVLAVAGSGKTSTMVKRIRYLVEKHGVPPSSIQVLMFNRLAKEQFVNRIEAEGVPHGSSVRVNTFHSFAYQTYNRLVGHGIVAQPDFWTGDREEIYRSRIRMAVQEVQRRIQDQTLNPEDAEQAISLWKASMIPPERAGHRFNSAYVAVYTRYEQLRAEANGVTFDDMMTDVVRILSHEKKLAEAMIPNVAYLIVDEYQDVNYVQQRLVELVSNGRSDIMVVGDDDQTIYEWRGARPEYIRKFHEIFNDRPCVDYTLTRSFRFGPIIAQCAHNVIHNNSRRHPKKVVAHHVNAEGYIRIIHNPDAASSSGLDNMVTQIVAKVKETGDPQKLVVLGRTWAQLMSIQGAFLRHEIPFYLIGQQFFTQLYETKRMLDYLTLCVRFQDRMDDELIAALKNVLNFPRRYISRTFVEDVPRLVKGTTVDHAIATLADQQEYPRQKESLRRMRETLAYIHRQIHNTKPMLAHEAVELLSNAFNLAKYFQSFYGPGESSDYRMMWLLSFTTLAREARLDVASFVNYVRSLDPKRGQPESECIPVTTIFQTKGLEYDYVFIPDCVDGFVPVHSDNVNPCYDKEGIVQEPNISSWQESERRLFYVGITRARKGVYILTEGTHNPFQNSFTPPSFSPSPYIAETHHQAVTAVFTALQRIAAEQTADSQEILKHYDKYGNVKPVTQMLLEHYLPELGLEGIAQALRKKVDTIDKTTPKPEPSPKPQKTHWWDKLT